MDTADPSDAWDVPDPAEMNTVTENEIIIEAENDESSSGTVEQNQQKEMGGIGNDLELKTVDSLEESIKELASMDGFENVYTELPKINLDNIIVPNFEIV